MERIALVLQDSISQKNLPMDRAHICLSNGIPVTAALQITGQQKELGPRFKQVQRLVEIEHDFRYCSDAAENLVTRLLQPSNYGFMVPANLEFTLHNVSPSSHFDCSLPNHKHYISMHNNINQFCVLEYTQIPEERFYVLLGLQEEGKAWVKLLPYSQPIQEVWETGHGLESKRLPTSQTAKLFVGATYIYAKIYKSKTLQVNSHVLDFSNYYMGHHLTK
ncbi:hypothetical protein VKT23_007976 [Stygiomarasmius scandens]|uniref:Uncharacterized protein n=1 Tax=Marasmiellus scandens TaxID=2682957 RepID=A0ABR1JJR7_9AGAR